MFEYSVPSLGTLANNSFAPWRLRGESDQNSKNYIKSATHSLTLFFLFVIVVMMEENKMVNL